MLEQSGIPCPWHEPLWTALAAQPQHAHAYLFGGPPGIGKRLFAEAFAAFLLCLKPQHAMACGQCRSCLLRQAGSHPDVLVVAPEEEGKAIRVDAVRRLGEFMAQTAQQGGRKVILLYPAEAMNQNAANALLKSLEEPTQDTFLLLVSDQPSRLLATIRSRCLVQPLGMPTFSAAVHWLSQSMPELSEAQRESLVAMANGAPLRAAELAAMDALSMRADVVDGVKALLKGQTGASQLAERWTKIPLELIIDWFHSWTLDLLRLSTGAVNNALNADMDKVLGYMSQRLDRSGLMSWQAWLLEHRAMVLGKANLNRVLLLESMLLQWKRLVERR